MYRSKLEESFWRKLTVGCKSLKTKRQIPASGSATRAGMIFLTNGQGTFDGGAYPFSTVQLGPLGYN
jgi:hypothetical protein